MVTTTDRLAESGDVAAAMLAWYDRHRRHLPWRAAPGEPADPYRVWLSEIMLQQTTVVTVKPYFESFLARWPTVGDLAAAPLDAVLSAWAGLGYYARARNLHACAQAVAHDHDGVFPSDEAGLRALPGIGPYTAAAIAAIAFDRPATPVDGNIERVIARMYRIATPLPAAKPEIAARARALTPPRRAGDYAQALMDLGATICTPRKPACALCPWGAGCAGRRDGDPTQWPVKAPKRNKPKRVGVAFVYWRGDGQMLFRQRPPRGLLGGMTEVPSSEWRPAGDPTADLAAAPVAADWRPLSGHVRHVFTHFELSLTLFAAKAAGAAAAPQGFFWHPVDRLETLALPSVMAKVVRHGLARLT